MNGVLDDPKVFDASATDAAAQAPAVEINKSATVSILGYHDFKDRGGTPMLISSDKFRIQMQAIKDSKIPVIPNERSPRLEARRKGHPRRSHRHHHG